MSNMLQKMSMHNRKLKLKLFHGGDRKCHWCKRETILTYIPKQSKGIPIPPLMATIDHINSKLSPRRFDVDGASNKVLACFECNSTRAAEEVRNLSKFELSLRGQGFTLKPNNKKNLLMFLENPS